jgi:hypothetical protein
MVVGADPVAQEIGDALEGSPRLSVGGWGLELRIETNADGPQACLVGPSLGELGCGTVTEPPQAATAPGDEEGGADREERVAVRIADDFHRRVFAPRVDLSQADIGSLDGANRGGRDALGDVLVPAEE